jgi:hypothetical protein
MSSVRTETKKGKQTATERADKARSGNRILLIGLLVLVVLLVSSAFVTRIFYLEGH